MRFCELAGLSCLGPLNGGYFFSRLLVAANPRLCAANKGRRGVRKRGK